MQKNVIVSRHPAAIEFIRAERPDFADAPVLASASPDDVRGYIVAGNLPLHLAALASEVIAIEFTGQPPRGTEYTIDEMRTAGAHLASYTVRALPAPRFELVWSDKIGSRNREPFLFLIHEGQIHEFRGKSIPGICAVAGTSYTKMGKWSNTTYRLQLTSGVQFIYGYHGWETGRLEEGLEEATGLPCQSWEDISHALMVDETEVRRLLADWPNTIARLDAVRNDVAAI